MGVNLGYQGTPKGIHRALPIGVKRAVRLYSIYEDLVVKTRLEFN